MVEEPEGERLTALGTWLRRALSATQRFLARHHRWFRTIGAAMILWAFWWEWQIARDERRLTSSEILMVEARTDHIYALLEWSMAVSNSEADSSRDAPHRAREWALSKGSARDGARAVSVGFRAAGDSAEARSRWKTLMRAADSTVVDLSTLESFLPQVGDHWSDAQDSVRAYRQAIEKTLARRTPLHLGWYIVGSILLILGTHWEGRDA